MGGSAPAGADDDLQPGDQPGRAVWAVPVPANVKRAAPRVLEPPVPGVRAGAPALRAPAPTPPGRRPAVLPLSAKPLTAPAPRVVCGSSAACRAARAPAPQGRAAGS